MDSRSSDLLDSPKRLKTLASNVKFSGGNVLLHKFVLDNSHPNDSGSEIYVRAVLMSMSDVPASAVNALNDEGFTALHLAVLKNNLLLVTKLLSYLANIDVSTKCGRGHGNTALHLAVELGRVSVIQELSMFDVPASAVNALNDEGFTALHLAVLKNNLLLVTKLLSCLKNIDVSARCGRGDGNTALHLAVELGHLSIIQKMSMFDVPASAVNALNDEGFTALHLAVLKNNRQMVEKLLSCLTNIDVNARGGRGHENTALHLAVESGHLSIVQELFNKGASIDIMNSAGATALMVAIKLRALETVKILVSADVNQRNSDFTPLHIAAWYGSSEIAEFLIDQGADIEARDGGGRTPLHDALFGGHLDVIKLLVGKGADLHATDDVVKTPLHVAALTKKFQCATFLIDQGADLHAADENGRTPLHYAAYGGYADVVRALLDRGAVVNARDVNGRTPLDMAIERQNQSNIDVLQNVG